MSTKSVVEAFWAAMCANDWGGAAEYFVEDIAVVWPCSGEQIIGRKNFAEIQATYPSNTHRWTFDIHRIVIEGDTAVSEVTAGDGEQSALVIAFSTVRHGQIVEQVEYWPAGYEPPSGRGHLTQPADRLP